jgi:hypothetical protein
MMRINVYQKFQISFLNLVFLVLIINFISIPMTVAQPEPALIIEIYDSNDWNETAGNVFFEDRTYDIIVSSENETVVLGVNISFLGTTYTTSLSEPFITVLSPHFNESESFVIIATKDGYLAAEIEITVMKGQLSVVADRGIIEEKKGFQVTVRNQDNKPVEGAFIYVASEANPVVTDQQGIAYVRAPDVEMVTTVTIQVIKSGYFPGSTNIRVENVEGFAFNLSESQFLQILPILMAILVVIFAIIYVLWRQRRTQIISNKTPRIGPDDVPRTFQQDKQRQQFKNEPAIFPKKEKRDISISTPPSRVEEIRIPVQVKKKETTVLSKEKELKQVSNDEKKEQLEWFKGQDYMRYKLDELTGKIDQKTDGKWFEGENDSKNKVDETLNKSFKKKKIDEDDIK